MRIWILCAFLALAMPSAASAAAVKLGMTTAEARAALPGNRDIPVVDMPNYTMMFSEAARVTVGLCRGRVSWIAEDMGKTLADFVFHVQRIQADMRTAPRYSVYQNRSTAGEQSFVVATWVVGTSSVSVRHGLTSWGGEDVSFITSATETDDGVLGCK